MAGPTCSMLSPIPYSVDDLIEELVGFTNIRREKDCHWIGNTQAIGGTYKGDGRPFIWVREPTDPGDLATIAEVLQVTPAQEVGLAAMCNQEIDHQILGEMALWIAEKTSGFVDLGGCVELPPTGWPGRVARIPYDTASGFEAEYMVMDRVAFRAWVSCPTFRMVK
jgi:hypothetical protein